MASARRLVRGGRGRLESEHLLADAIGRGGSLRSGTDVDLNGAPRAHKHDVLVASRA
jgi:hypothetical protein